MNFNDAGLSSSLQTTLNKEEFGNGPFHSFQNTTRCRGRSIAHLGVCLVSREIVIDERATGLLNELDSYEWVPGQRNDRPKYGDDHHIDALRNAAKLIGRKTIGPIRRK